MRSSVLRAVPRDRRAWLRSVMRARSFEPGEVVFHEGDVGDALHVIVSGHVAARTTTPQGDVLTVALLGPGDQFGELSLLRSDHRHTATVVALDRLETLCLGRRAFEQLCHDDATTVLVLAHLLAASVERLDQLLAEAHFLPADRRIARRLADTARMFGGGPVPITQEELANLAGVSRATANQVLRRLERDGVLRLDRHHITVLSATALTAAGQW